MSEITPEQQPATPSEPTFTQAELDRIVGERVMRERSKFSDYDDLKAKAAGAKTVEDQLAELRAENEKTKRDALASRIAAKHGIAPEDADLFLTGADEDTITAQAKRLAERISDQRKQGNYVPNEGRTPKQPAANAELREFTRNLFAAAKAD